MLKHVFSQILRKSFFYLSRIIGQKYKSIANYWKIFTFLITVNKLCHVKLLPILHTYTSVFFNQHISTKSRGMLNGFSILKTYQGRKRFTIIFNEC